MYRLFFHFRKSCTSYHHTHDFFLLLHYCLLISIPHSFLPCSCLPALSPFFLPLVSCPCLLPLSPLLLFPSPLPHSSFGPLPPVPCPLTLSISSFAHCPWSIFSCPLPLAPALCPLPPTYCTFSPFPLHSLS